MVPAGGHSPDPSMPQVRHPPFQGLPCARESGILQSATGTHGPPVAQDYHGPVTWFWFRTPYGTTDHRGQT